MHVAVEETILFDTTTFGPNCATWTCSTVNTNLLKKSVQFPLRSMTPSPFTLLVDGNNSTVRQASHAVPLYRPFQPMSPTERSDGFPNPDGFFPGDSVRRIPARHAAMHLHQRRSFAPSSLP